MVGYKLHNTLTENGTVSRGVCDVNSDNFLTDVVERTKIIRKEDGKIYYTEDEENWVELPEEVNVSMNCWCFPASFIDEIEERLDTYYKLKRKYGGDVQTVLDSQDYIARLCELSGLPLFATTVRADLAQAVSAHIPDVFPLQLQEKYFDLPDQRI